MKKDFFILLILVLSVKVLSQTSADIFIDNGIKSYQSGNIEEAITHFSQAIRIDKENVNGHYFRGQMYLLNGEIDNAVIDFKNSVTIRDTLFQAFQYLGVCYLNKEDTNQALIYFDKSLKIKPKYFDALQNKATILLAKKLFKESIFLIDQTLILKPNDSKANFQKGFCLMSLKYKIEAIPFLEKSLALGYQDAFLYDLLAVCYLEKDDLSKALLMSNNAIIINSSIGGFYINNALILYKMNFNSTARDSFQKALKLGVLLNKEQDFIYNKIK